LYDGTRPWPAGLYEKWNIDNTEEANCARYEALKVRRNAELITNYNHHNVSKLQLILMNSILKFFDYSSF
jgi:hypothetical protein